MATKIGKDIEVKLTTRNGKGKVNVPVSVKGLDGNPGVWRGTEPPPDDSYTVWIKPDGGKYENGIWLGPGPVPEGYNVWINPDGEPQEELVTTVNGETGDVVLDAEDVGALPADTPIPKVDYLTNSDILTIWNNFQ